MWSDIVRDGGTIQISDVDHSRERNRAGTHAAITADAHVDLEAYLFLGEWTYVSAVCDTDQHGLF
jgi:hypothetical protein